MFLLLYIIHSFNDFVQWMNYQKVYLWKKERWSRIEHIRMSTAVCTRLNEIHIEWILNDHDTFLFDCDGVL